MSKKKKAIIIISVILAIVILAPYRSVLIMDGGSKGYGSVVYTVIKYHRLSEPDENENDTEYEVGWGIEIFDQQIYKNTHIIHEQ